MCEEDSSKFVDTGIVFRGHKIYFGPCVNSGEKADMLVLTSLDRFIFKHMPNIYKLLLYGNRVRKTTLVDGASEWNEGKGPLSED